MTLEQGQKKTSIARQDSSYNFFDIVYATLRGMAVKFPYSYYISYNSASWQGWISPSQKQLRHPRRNACTMHSFCLARKHIHPYIAVCVCNAISPPLSMVLSSEDRMNYLDRWRYAHCSSHEKRHRQYMYILWFVLILQNGAARTEAKFMQNCLSVTCISAGQLPIYEHP